MRRSSALLLLALAALCCLFPANVRLSSAAGSSTAGGTYVATAVTVGDTTACAIVSGGRIVCWGSDTEGQLGNGTTTPAFSSTPVAVKNMTNAKAVAQEGNTSCAIVGGGTVRCWGYGQGGELGNGKTSPTVNSTTPVRVQGISSAVKVSRGLASCAILSNATLECWGYVANAGQPTATPVAVAGLTDVTDVSGGQSGTSCAVAGGGSVFCWGDDVDGELGNGTNSGFPVYTPVKVSGISNAKAVSVGTIFACALLTTGSIKCWGANDQGHLGTGSYQPDDSPTPLLPVKGIRGAVAVSARWGSACALLSTGAVKCWGENVDGDFGNGTSNSSLVPVSVKGISGAKAISSGKLATCVLLSGGGVECWGDNESDMLGRGPNVTPLAQETPGFVVGFGPGSTTSTK